GSEETERHRDRQEMAHGTSLVAEADGRRQAVPMLLGPRGRGDKVVRNPGTQSHTTGDAWTIRVSRRVGAFCSRRENGRPTAEIIDPASRTPRASLCAYPASRRSPSWPCSWQAWSAFTPATRHPGPCRTSPAGGPATGRAARTAIGGRCAPPS